MKLYLLSIILLLLFTGCTGKPKPVIEVKQKPFPAWIMNPPKSDSSTLYGVGEGKDKQEALTNALNEIISTLSVSVASEYSSNTNVSNHNGIENYSNTTQANIKSKVKELRISNYQIINYEKIGFQKFAVLLKSNKKSIFNSLKDEIDKTLALLDAQEGSYKSANILQEFKFYKDAASDVDDLIYKSVIMKALDRSFNDRYITKEVAHYRNALTTMRSKISFSVHSDNESVNLISVVRDALTSKGLKIADQKNKYHLNITIRSQIVQTKASGFILARSAIDIDLKDAENQILSTRKLNITGQSTQGYQIAKQNIAYKLKRMIQEKGIGIIIDAQL